MALGFGPILILDPAISQHPYSLGTMATGIIWAMCGLLTSPQNRKSVFGDWLGVGVWHGLDPGSNT